MIGILMGGGSDLPTMRHAADDERPTQSGSARQPGEWRVDLLARAGSDAS